MFFFRRKALTLLLSGLFFLPDLPAQAPSLQFSTEAIDAYRQISALASTSQSLELLKIREPNNAISLYLEHLGDFLEEMVSGEDLAYRRLLGGLSARSKAIRQTKAGNPWREFCLGRMHLMCAIAASRRQERITAARHLRSALSLLRQGRAAHPAFLPLHMDHTLFEALLATAPEGHHWALEWLTGLSADPTGVQAMAVIYQKLRGPSHFLAAEAGAFHLLLLTHLDRRPDLALPAAETLLTGHPGQPILSFLTAWIAREHGNNDKSVAILRSIPEAARFAHAERLLGRALLSRLETGPARASFHRFMKQWRGNTYRAETWQFLSWSYLIDGHEAQAKRFAEACIRESAFHLDGDAQARRQVLSGRSPHPGLLRTRLLFDGGYLALALRELNKIQADVLSALDQREYQYRKGRIHQAMGHPEVAMAALSITWQTGQGKRDHYACAAALQLGHLHSDAARPLEARQWYERSLAERPEDYRTGLHQKARAGLQRLRGL